MKLDNNTQRSVLLQLVDHAARQGVPDASPQSVQQVVILGQLRMALESAEVADATLNASAFDNYADAELVRAFDLAVADPSSLIRTEFDAALRYGRDDVERAGLAHFGVDGSVFVNYMQLARLHNGAITQEAGRVRRLESVFRSLLEQNPTLAGREAAAALLN